MSYDVGKPEEIEDGQVACRHMVTSLLGRESNWKLVRGMRHCVGGNAIVVQHMQQSSVIKQSIRSIHAVLQLAS
jgi:hypothetical protein